MLRQIGNAIPPLFVKHLIRHIRRQLQRSDGLPVSVDQDEFMSADELRNQETAQFYGDRRLLLEGAEAGMDDFDAVGIREEEEQEEEIVAKRSEAASKPFQRRARSDGTTSTSHPLHDGRSLAILDDNSGSSSFCSDTPGRLFWDIGPAGNSAENSIVLD